MDSKNIPDSLLIELKKQGYSDDAIRELYKWYASLERKEVGKY